jgi:hypothetical protein
MAIGTGTAILGSALLGGAMSSKAASKAAKTSAASADYATGLQKEMYDQTREDQTPWRDTGANALSQLSYLMGLSPNIDREQFINGSARQKATLDNFDAAGYLAANPDVARDRQFGGNPLGHFQQYGIRENRNLMLPTYDESGYQSAIQEAQSGPDFGSLTKTFGMDDFNADPGYQFRMDQGTSALQNSAAARGGLKSGNTLKALMEYGQNLGSQEYGNAYNRFNTDQNTQYNRLSNMAGLGQTANTALQGAGTNYANSVGNLMSNNAANQGNAMLAGANARGSAFSAIGQAAGNYFGGQNSNSGYASMNQNAVQPGYGYGEPLEWGAYAGGGF